MKYWINTNSEVDNVVLLNDRSLIIGSCDEEKIDDTKTLIEQQKPFEEIFGTDNYEIIQYSQIEQVLSRSTDVDVDIEYKDKNGEDTKYIEFESIETSETFLATIASHLPKKFKKKQYQQSFIAAGLPALLSLITALAASAIFINKLRWVTLILGGIWVLVSLYTLFKRVLNPPTISIWSSRNVVGNAWSQIKTAGSFAFLAIIVLAISTRFPDSYGTNSFVQHMEQEKLGADDVETLVKNGGNINAQDSYGSPPLHYAVYTQDLPLFTELLKNGADPSLADEAGDDAMDEAVDYQQNKMVELLLTDYQTELPITGKLNHYIETSAGADILELLFENGANASETNSDGFNALQIALLNSADYDVIAKLIEYQVPTNVKVDGLTLKQYALNNGQDDVARLFDNRKLSFERERQLTQKIDAFYEQQIKQRMNQAPASVKLIARASGLSDEDTKEYAKELSAAMQYKSLSAWGNQQIILTYSEACEKIAFTDAEDFKKRASQRNKNLQSHGQVSELILERNRSIYDEAKDKYIVPSDFQSRVTAKINSIQNSFSKSTDTNIAELNKKCSSIYKRLLPKK